MVLHGTRLYYSYRHELYNRAPLSQYSSINNYTHAACPIGTYLSPSSGSCSDCPANSVSEEEGLAQCTCIEGYQRGESEQGGQDLPCTGKAYCTIINQ